MNEIILNCVLKGLGQDAPFVGLHRVLWIHSDENKESEFIVTIEIPLRADRAPSPRYYRAPQKHSRETIEGGLVAGSVVTTSLILPPLVYMSDDEIRTRYPQRKGKTKRRIRTDCALLQIRDAHYRLIKPLIDAIEKDPAAAYETDYLDSIKQDILRETRASHRDILNALHKYLARSCGKNGLLPDTDRSGAKGTSREPRKTHRLGRPAVGSSDRQQGEPVGIHLSPIDKQHIAMGWRRWLKLGLPVKQAHVLTLGAWWSSGTKLIDGKAVPVLLPAAQRPSIKQFRYWGPRGNTDESAFRLHLPPDAWEKKYRPKLGTSFDGVTAVGQIGLIDATPNDVDLTSIDEVLKAIGTCSRICIHDACSDVICGVYCGLEAPSGRTALLAVLNAASEKVEFCRRFGVEITSDQFPAVFFRRYRADNGELRATEPMSALSGLQSGVELVQRGRPDRKGMVESGHHSMQRLYDHHVAGTTHGRTRQRGEDHSAIAACWNWFDYMTQLIRAIIHFNCVADATEILRRHPFRTEMARDGVAPTRANIHKWCVEHNRIASPPCDLMLLRAHLLPVMRAVVKQNGIFLLRTDRGDKKEVITGPRFSGPRAIELGWHQANVKSFYINVRCDVNDLSCIWYCDDCGIHALQNLSRDEVLRREGTLDDCLVLQDNEQWRSVQMREVSEQGLSDFVSLRENTDQQRRADKKAAIAATGRKVSKTELRSGLDLNREVEARRLAELIDPIDRVPRSTPTVPPEATAAKPPSTAGRDASPSSIDSALKAFRSGGVKS